MCYFMLSEKAEQLQRSVQVQCHLLRNVWQVIFTVTGEIDQHLWKVVLSQWRYCVVGWRVHVIGWTCHVILSSGEEIVWYCFISEQSRHRVYSSYDTASSVNISCDTVSPGEQIMWYCVIGWTVHVILCCRLNSTCDNKSSVEQYMWYCVIG
jgi:hypothetical protein